MPQLIWLDAHRTPDFPPTHAAMAHPNGLLAAGGDLTPPWLLTAYRNGIFPWFNEGEPILWWSPSPRMVLAPGAMHVSRSLAKAYRRHPYGVTLNQAFDAVIEGCRAPREDQPGTWITAAMSAAYRRLHTLGWAHSVEVWDGDRLIGGLYGVGIAPVFFGESMFSRQTNASKIALLALSEWAHAAGMTMIDCQVYNDHLSSLGAREIDRDDFERHLPSSSVPLDPPASTQVNEWVRRRLSGRSGATRLEGVTQVEGHHEK